LRPKAKRLFDGLLGEVQLHCGTVIADPLGLLFQKLPELGLELHGLLVERLPGFELSRQADDLVRAKHDEWAVDPFPDPFGK